MDRNELHMINRMLEENEFDGTVACPDCRGMGFDDQYCCTTCWSQGGEGYRHTHDIVEALVKEIERLKQKCGEK
ncbi:hypothetical protein phiAS5_ORF0296 [Aeromonas phage phiAS5]|uniref:Uncharacterized protein n=1 Tax=Aeromonas phage phiAS5 TaxID=879630 RepID=E1A250_9CAUD|nr:hypothetical protein phiAS5_ORF0296 [Aeromonas phage phiAS5]ADM80139.1 hypothetical protein phiAS5_ORF0296 [Aeromonas phage phiAS5]